MEDVPRAAAKLLWLALACVLAAILAQYLNYVIQAVRFPFGLDYSEGLIWQQALWTPGPHMYGDISHYPFVVFEYPPLYLVAVRLTALLGCSMLVAGRCISIVSTLAACAMLGAVVTIVSRQRHEKRPAMAAGAIAAILPLTLLPILSWSPLMRVDMLALAFTYAGILLGTLSLRRPGLLTWAVLAFVAAAFTKQVYIAAAVALFPVSLVREPKRAVRAYATGAFVGLAAAAGLAWMTHGGFIRHVFLYSINKVDFAASARLTGTWVQAYPLYSGLVVVAIVLLWVQSVRKGPGQSVHNVLAAVRSDDRAAFVLLLTIYLSLTTVMLASAGKIGASRNYFIEWMCAWCVSIGVLIPSALESSVGIASKTKRMLTLCMPLLLLLQALPVTMALRTMGSVQFSQARRREWTSLEDRVRTIAGPVLSDDMVLLIHAGKEVGLEPCMLTALAQTGFFDERKLVDLISTRSFGAVVTAYDPGDPTFDSRYLPATQAAMLASYPRVEMFGDYRLRLPR